MRVLVTFFFVVMIALLSSCDLRSETAKREMEKFISSPTPPILPAPTKAPIAPADILTVDTTLEGPTISIDGFKQKKTAACTKYNRVMVNGDDNTITIKGSCRQIMINGDGNKISADAAMEFTFNGSENTLNYSKFANGKHPIITENKPGNTIEKTMAEITKDRRPTTKNVK